MRSADEDCLEGKLMCDGTFLREPERVGDEARDPGREDDGVWEPRWKETMVMVGPGRTEDSDVYSRPVWWIYKPGVSRVSLFTTW